MLEVFAANPVTAPLAVASVLAQVFEGRKARRASKTAAAIDLKTRLIQARQARVAQLSEMQKARAALSVQSQATGTTDSSGVLGAGASLASQFGANSALSAQMDVFGHQAAGAQFKIGKYNWRVGTAGTIGNLAMMGIKGSGVKAPESVPGAPNGAGWTQAEVDAFRLQLYGKPAPMSAPTVTYRIGNK